MAKFIKFTVTSASANILDGSHLVNVNEIMTVDQTDTTSTIIYLANWLAAGTGQIDITTTPASAANKAPIKDAVNSAMTANPGGVVASVNLPSGTTITGFAIT